MIGFTFLFCILLGVVLPGSISTKAQSVGSAADNGITLTINDVSLIDNDQRLKVNFTIHSVERHQVKQQGVRLMQSPHIWLDDMLVRGSSVSYKKIGNHDYNGTIIAQLHQYRPALSHGTFQTGEILNQRGLWKIGFTLKNP
jgi:hypothetical protein